MRTTIDRAGRIVIPKGIRRAARLEGPQEVAIRVEGGSIVIEAVTCPVRLARKGPVTVAVPIASVGPLLRGVVEETIERLREDPGRGE